MTTPIVSKAGWRSNLGRMRGGAQEPKPRTLKGVLLGLAGLVGGALFLGAMLSCVLTLAIWPGEVKLFAPVVCSSERPDAYVVSFTTGTQDGGTATSYTMYCMGPRGDSESHGFFGVFMLATAMHAGLIILITLALGLWIRFKRRRAGPPTPPPAVTTTY